MPAVLATLARQLIIMLVQTAAFVAVEKALMAIIDKIRAHHAEVNGLDPNDADNETANTIIDIAILAGITMVSLRSKLPVKIAERLGFTSKGFVKRPLSAKGQATLKAKGVKPVTTTATVATTAEEITATVVATRGKPFAIVSSAVNIILKVLAIPVGLGLVITNTMDFGAWPSSSYQTTVQKFLSFFGLEPDKEAANSRVLSDDMWKKILATYQNLGAVGINNPFTGQSQPFTRETLIALVDKVAANMTAEGTKVTFEKMFGATQGFLVFNSPVTDNKINSVFGNTAVASAVASPYQTSIQITKVFTGIVSQGVVGAGLVFTSRPDDMIESIEELRSAASNNLAPFLATLPGKIVYEVKVVSSIITKDGFKQTGTTQRIQTGTYSNGIAKYKTVTNKFATLVVYALTDKGSRTKLTTIVLGPTDSSKLTVAQNDLQALQNELPALVTTNNINEITNIKNTTDKYSMVTGELNPDYIAPTISVIPTSNTTQAQTLAPNWWNKLGISDERWNSGEFTGVDKAANKEVYDMQAKSGNFPNALKITNYIAGSSASVPATVPSVTSPAIATGRSGASATTLFEWYQAQGQTLPSVAERSIIYEGLGLGSRSYYTGTSEQNTKLLNALKA